jgi:hypothetical protein
MSYNVADIGDPSFWACYEIKVNSVTRCVIFASNIQLPSDRQRKEKDREKKFYFFFFQLSTME